MGGVSEESQDRLARPVEFCGEAPVEPDGIDGQRLQVEKAIAAEPRSFTLIRAPAW